jgi:exodeoxyribonuclease V beta subunit
MSTPDLDILETPIPAGETLVEASAGTGKTYALTGLVVRLVLEGVDLRQLLVVTFTIAATGELTTRIRAALRETLAAFTPEQPPAGSDLCSEMRARFGATEDDRQRGIDRLMEALQAVDEASVFTIHGFCKRVLEQAAFESGAPFAAEFTDDASELLDRAVADFWHRRSFNDPWLAALMLDLEEGDLRQHYFNAKRYPNTRILPEPRPLDEALTRLRDAAARLAEVWDTAAVTEALDGISWLRGGAFGKDGEPAATIAAAAAAASGAAAGNLEALARLAPDAIRACAYQRGEPARLAEEASRHPIFAACKAASDALEEVQQGITHAFIAEVDQRYEELKQEARLLTFDDLLKNVHRALAPDAPARETLIRSIQSRWSHALIDEFQDTDPLQYAIFREAFRGCPLVFVGDPKQAIYSFRGADLFAYLDARRNAASRYALGRNWRSASKLVEAVNRLFERPQRPFIYDGIPYEPIAPAGKADEAPLAGDGRPPLVWWYVEPEERASGPRPLAKGKTGDLVVRGVVAEIQRLLAGGMTIGDKPLAPHHFAVLVRTNYQAAAMQDALRRANIPSVISKSGDVWKSREVADLEYLLRAFLRPHDLQAVCTALCTDFWGYDALRVQDFRQNEDLVAEAAARLARWADAWRRHGVLHAITRFIEEESVAERLLKYADGERRMTNLRHALELLHQAEQDRQRSPEEILNWLRGREKNRLTDSEEAQLRLESDALAVQIATIHASKGLQYDIVFAPYLWDCRTRQTTDRPLVHADDAMVYDLGSEALGHHFELAEAERLSEDLRLAYVALTRAKHRCYVATGAINKAEASALAYLLQGHAATPDEPPHHHVKAAIAKARRGQMSSFTPLADLVEAHPDLMALEEVPEAGPLFRRPGSAGDGATFAPRLLSRNARERLEPWSITSFSALTAAVYDEGEFALPDLTEGPPPAGMRAFAAGTQPGLCLHEILEEVDFQKAATLRQQDAHTGALRRLVDRKLRAYGLENGAAHRERIDPEETVLDMLASLASVPVPGAGTPLADLPANRQIPEWRFTLPVGQITPPALADAVARHAGGDIAERYPPLLRRLSEKAVGGFLTGFADLVFEHDGRWFVLDWKSTLLGDQLDDYAPARLADAALSHHYLLQLYVYALGLHRYLRTRLADYHYETHFGGAAVVFLRGLDGQTDSGFFSQRPPAGLIDALDALLRPASRLPAAATAA